MSCGKQNLKASVEINELLEVCRVATTWVSAASSMEGSCLHNCISTQAAPAKLGLGDSIAPEVRRGLEPLEEAVVDNEPSGTALARARSKMASKAAVPEPLLLRVRLLWLVSLTPAEDMLSSESVPFTLPDFLLAGSGKEKRFRTSLVSDFSCTSHLTSGVLTSSSSGTTAKAESRPVLRDRTTSPRRSATTSMEPLCLSRLFSRALLRRRLVDSSSSPGTGLACSWRTLEDSAKFSFRRAAVRDDLFNIRRKADTAGTSFL